MRVKKAEAGYKEAVKKDPPGEGGRFRALQKDIEARGASPEKAAATAAAIGRKKYGSAGMARMSAKGRK